MACPPIAATRLGILLITACVTSLGLSRLVAAQHDLMADDPTNDTWQIVTNTQQAVFTPTKPHQTPSIVLSLDAMAQTAARLIVQSDTKTINFKAGELQFELPIRKNRNTKIFLDAHPDRADIRVKGRQLGSVLGIWLGICRAGATNVTLTFTSATYANITFKPIENPEAESQATSAPAEPQPTNHDNPSAQMLKSVKQALFQLRVKGRREQVFSAGTGFLIADGGFAITNFHVIQGATSAVARFTGSDTPIAVELFAARADLDLALIRLNLADVPGLQNVIPLGIETSAPAEGQDVWAVGFPKDPGYTVTRGVVSGVHPHAQLPKRLQQSLGHTSQSVWIQTEATINSGNAGGPLVNIDGRVVAVNTWVWQQGVNQFLALSGTHINELLKSKPDQPLTFAKAAVQYSQVRSASGSFPRVIIKTNGDPEKLITTAQALRNAIGCKTCNNKGIIRQRVQDGYTYEGPVAHPKYVTKTRVCPTCRGTLIQNRGNLNKVAAVFVTTLAGADPLHPRYEDATNFTKHTLSEVLKKNTRGMQKLLNGEAHRLFSSETEQIGAPIIAIGNLVRNIRLSGENKRLQVFKFGKSKQQLVISDARLIETTGPGTVIVAGVLAGFIDGPDGEPIPVIQHGLIIGTPPT